MTKGRKTWFIIWIVIIVIIGLFSGIAEGEIIGGILFAFPLLILLGFIELIRFFIVSIKRAKIKTEEQKQHFKELREQQATLQDEDEEYSMELSSQSEQITDIPEYVKPKRKGYFQSSAGKNILANILVVILGPLIMLINPIIKAFTGRSTSEYIKEKMGVYDD